MKALTVKQPWADLIVQGRKTIELREWRPKHRGLLAIQAGLEVSTDDCREHNLDCDRLPKGAIVGTVEVAGVIEFDQDLWDELRDQHLCSDREPGERLGWRLRNPRRLQQPVPCRGWPGKYDVPEDVAAQLRWADGGRVTESPIFSDNKEEANQQ
ncbi:MAG: ASCH domain-containing protein [Anaerolineae bacterium]|nr:ASCH domain-containing protein [Anaerolineae bacterium]NIN95893.1 ASCH domain-containing protein [Anaerolineae bacterium]NIQ78865.1 ASCH domain-containing protein [Anaerolineae bacterium]